MITRTGLAQTLKNSLHDSAHALGEDSVVYERCVDTALQAFTRLRPHRQHMEIRWSFGGPSHDIPANTLSVALVQWSDRVVSQWKAADNLAPPPPPQATIVQGSTGAQLCLSAPLHGKAPSAGTVFVTLHVPHQIPAEAMDSTPQTVSDADEDLLLLRAQAEALRELAARGVSKPVSLRDGHSQGAANGTPTALYQRLLVEFKEAMLA